MPFAAAAGQAQVSRPVSAERPAAAQQVLALSQQLLALAASPERRPVVASLAPAQLLSLPVAVLRARAELLLLSAPPAA